MKQIKNLRHHAKLSLREMATELKTSPTLINFWERGIYHPNIRSMRKLLKLAKKYNFELKFI